MYYSLLRVRNFRSIRKSDLSLSPFVCAVGHNNSGKSSLLMAMSLFRSGSSLKSSDFYDHNDDIVIEATIEGVTADALRVIGESHREKLMPFIEGGKLTLVRRYPAGSGKSSLRCFKRMPKDARFTDDSISEVLRGSGKALRESFESEYPELVSHLESGNKPQKYFKEVLRQHIATLDPDDLELVETALPSGIDQSVTDLLPEVIFIPAVKDVRDELKMSESASFGKIISVLMDMIKGSDDFKAIEASFSDLDAMINRQVTSDGATQDNRLEEVRTIENTVGRYVREQFRDVAVSIEIPPPSVKDVFRNAKIILDDGVPGDVDSKGDGVKRAVTFALLRTFVDLRNKHRQEPEVDMTTEHGHFLFLFEEPELYLHPNAQRVLFDALVQIASDHQVCVCTHSPYFFSPEDSGTFLRLRKSPPDTGNSSPPATEILPLHLHDNLSVKDLYQILCYENNSAAFFCDRVVLVEGDCDVIYLQHVAKMLNSKWDFQRRNVAVVKIGGKGSFSRYRTFFQECGVDVKIVADLDTLVDQFTKLNASKVAGRQHSELLQIADGLADHEVPELSPHEKRDIVRSRTFQENYDRLRAAAFAWNDNKQVASEDLPEIDAMFGRERDQTRRKLLAEASQLEPDKLKLLATLRQEGIYVLSRGAIEQYYPDDVTGPDKPSRAICACEKVSCRDEALRCSSKLEDERNSTMTELELIFSGIFDGMPADDGLFDEAVVPVVESDATV